MPASSRDNTGFSIYPGGSTSCNSYCIGAGGQRGGPSAAKTFTPKETQSIDGKIDDGVAGTGKVFGRDGASGGNVPYLSITAGTCLNAGEYDLTLDSQECWVLYRQ